MLIRILGKSVESTQAIAAHVSERLQAALGQHEGNIRQVTVRLADVNGPRKGNDMRCTVSVALRPSGSVIVKQLHDDLYAAVSLAADRAKQAVGRTLTRRTEHRV